MSGIAEEDLENLQQVLGKRSRAKQKDSPAKFIFKGDVSQKIVRLFIQHDGDWKKIMADSWWKEIQKEGATKQSAERHIRYVRNLANKQTNTSVGKNGQCIFPLILLLVIY